MTTVATPLLGRARDGERARATSAWRRLVRVAWLEHRGAFVSLFVVLVAFAITVLVEVGRVEPSYASFVADGCVGHANTTACNADALALGGDADFRTIGTALTLLPLLVGVFIGAPLVSRELESGTFRFAWTQGTSRGRALRMTITALALASVGTAVVLGLLFGGRYAHIYEVVIATVVSQWQATPFAATWWMLATWTALALGIGTLLGALIKRTVAAMAATAAIVGSLIAAAYVLLPEMLHLGALTARDTAGPAFGIGPINAPAQLGAPTPPGSWDVRSWLTGPNGAVLNTQQTQDASSQYGESVKNDGSWQAWLAHHHFTAWVSYQPVGHFWIVQGVEGLVVLALAAVCVLATLRAIHSRVPA